MSVNTVKTHLKHIYAKLNVTSRAAAVDRSKMLDLI
jgi:ATP/maltotriose-dependent transcriptional regulator MalT